MQTSLFRNAIMHAVEVGNAIHLDSIPSHLFWLPILGQAGREAHLRVFLPHTHTQHHHTHTHTHTHTARRPQKGHTEAWDRSPSPHLDVQSSSTTTRVALPRVVVAGSDDPEVPAYSIRCLHTHTHTHTHTRSHTTNEKCQTDIWKTKIHPGLHKYITNA